MNNKTLINVTKILLTKPFQYGSTAGYPASKPSQTTSGITTYYINLDKSYEVSI